MYLPVSIVIMLTMASFTSSSISSVPLETNQHFPQHSNQLQQDSHIVELQQKVKYPTLSQETAEDNSVIRNGTDSLKNDASVSRTFFGLRRRLKMAIPVIMYKLGVATTMLGVLTLLSAKSLIVGLIILVLQLTTGLAKLFALKKEHHEPTWEEEPPHKPPQNIHVHVHGGGHGGGHYKTSYSLSPWGRISDSGNSREPDAYGSRISDYLNNRFQETLSSRIDEDYYQRLKELKELKALRESLYTQVI